MVVTCMDPRLTRMLEQALGLPRIRAVVVRTAGNRISSDTHDTLRSVAAGVYLKQVSEVFIVGHTDCGMATFSAADVIQRFRSAGVPRSAFGDEDIRRWFGAIPDEITNVRESVEFLRSSGLLNASILIHGLLLDSQTGAELITSGYDVENSAHMERATVEEKKEVMTQVSPGAVPPEIPPPLRASHRDAREKEHREGGTVPQRKDEVGDDLTAQSRSVVEYLLKQAQSSPELGKVMPRILEALRHEKNPVRIINLVERSIRDYGVLSPATVERFEQIRKVVRSRPEASAALLDFVRHLTE